MQCRYNGHVQRFMRVAEHCVLVSRLVSPENALWGLLHDATEAYVGDMIRPLKLHMPEYRAVEDRAMLAIAGRFNISPAMPAEVHEADSRILLDERAALLSEPPGDWGIRHEPFGIDVEGVGPDPRAEGVPASLHRTDPGHGDHRMTTTNDTVASAAPAPLPRSGGAWARDLGDQYSKIARTSTDPRKAEANAAEASKYYDIADRIDRALPNADQPGEEHKP